MGSAHLGPVVAAGNRRHAHTLQHPLLKGPYVAGHPYKGDTQRDRIVFNFPLILPSASSVVPRTAQATENKVGDTTDLTRILDLPQLR